MNPKLELLEKWVDAFNDKDLATIADCYSDDVVNYQIWCGSSLIGKQEVISYRQKYFDAFPDALATVCNILIDGAWASIEWQFKGTFLKKFLDYDPTGKKFDMKASSFVKVESGSIIFQRDYWDRSDWCQQLGITG